MSKDQLSSEEIISKLYVPEYDSATPIKDGEAQFIYDFIKSHGIKKTLETGFAYAKSAAHIIASTQSRHIAIDPFQDHYQRLGIKNIAALGFEKFLELREDYAHNVLPELIREKEKFEFIFVDGDHKFDGEFIDFYYADLLLESEGFILLHDTWMRSTRLLMKFISTNRKEYKQLPTGLRNLALYQKCGEDGRNGMFFREFYTRRSTLSYYLIMWMTSGKRSWIKRFLFYLKERMK